jgi:hypothetical protein
MRCLEKQNEELLDKLLVYGWCLVDDGCTFGLQCAAVCNLEKSPI